LIRLWKNYWWEGTWILSLIILSQFCRDYLAFIALGIWKDERKLSIITFSIL
jgi:hypothetical protein